MAPVDYVVVCDVCGERSPSHAPDWTLAGSAPCLVPAPTAFSGLAGDVVRALEPYTEADPAAILTNLLVQFGAMVGSMAECRAGSALHPPASYVAFVGRTSRLRKGTTEREISALMSHVEQGWEARHRIGGFGSGEAFIQRAADRPGEAIYMVEPEFARVLAVASREGSSASSVLRAAWDFSRLEHRIRKRPSRHHRLRSRWWRTSPWTSSGTAATDYG